MRTLFTQTKSRNLRLNPNSLDFLLVGQEPKFTKEDVMNKAIKKDHGENGTVLI